MAGDSRSFGKGRGAMNDLIREMEITDAESPTLWWPGIADSR
jgi:hypothetical protein